jgi:hypothetical protein
VGKFLEELYEGRFQIPHQQPQQQQHKALQASTDGVNIVD